MKLFNSQPPLPKRQKLILLFSLAFLMLGGIYSFYWLFWGRFNLFTENAYVGGNLVQLMSQVAGVVTTIAVDDTDLVKEGQVLVQLDDTDAKVNLQNAIANLAEQVRQVVQYYKQKEELTAKLALSRAEWLQAENDLKRRKRLIGIEAVSKEELERFKTNVIVAEKKNQAMLLQLQKAEALVKGTTVSKHPLVQIAATKVRLAYLNFIRTKLIASVTGYVAKRTVQPGQQVTPGMPLLFIVPLKEIWVDANYKESLLKNIRIGQPATIVTDTYGDAVKFNGTVMGISPGTGAVFSVLPPQNASGNWIRVLQRLPVRIALNPGQLVHHPLRVGMSGEVIIDTRNRSGKMLATLPRVQALYHTDIYKNQLLLINSVITKTIYDNTSA